MKPTKAIALFVSVAATAALFSPNQAVQDFGYYVILITCSLCAPFVLLIGLTPIERVRELSGGFIRSLTLTSLQIGGLLYADHPILAAFSGVMWAILWGSMWSMLQDAEAKQ